MKIDKPTITLGIAILALLVSGLTFLQTDNSRKALGLPPSGYAVAKTEDISFFYPKEDLIFVDNGLWQRDLYERLLEEGKAKPASDTMPYIRVSSVEKKDQSLEEIAIAEQQFGSEKTLADTDFFKQPSESFSYGYTNIGGRNVLWVHAAEKFDVTTYYFVHENRVIIFSTLNSSDENIALVESLIETVK